VQIDSCADWRPRPNKQNSADALKIKQNEPAVELSEHVCDKDRRAAMVVTLEIIGLASVAKQSPP
jgi:hypothetical protein